jgi:hypothetical protein
VLHNRPTFTVKTDRLPAQLESKGAPLLGVRDCLFNIFASAAHTSRSSPSSVVGTSRAVGTGTVIVLHVTGTVIAQRVT